MKVTMSIKGTDKAISTLEKFKGDIITKSRLFVSKLADLGISVAQYKTNYIDDIGTITSFIGYTKTIQDTTTGIECTIMAKQSANVTKSWMLADGTIKTVKVDALLMAEFGSGFYANATQEHTNAINVSVPVGQGTFPNQTHAFDNGGWSWKTPDGKWHHSKGIKPTMPMYSAYVEMQRQIDDIKKEVFDE